MLEGQLEAGEPTEGTHPEDPCPGAGTAMEKTAAAAEVSREDGNTGEMPPLQQQITRLHQELGRQESLWADVHRKLQNRIDALRKQNLELREELRGLQRQQREARKKPATRPHAGRESHTLGVRCGCGSLPQCPTAQTSGERRDRQAVQLRPHGSVLGFDLSLISRLEFGEFPNVFESVHSTGHHGAVYEKRIYAHKSRPDVKKEDWIYEFHTLNMRSTSAAEQIPGPPSGLPLSVLTAADVWLGPSGLGALFLWMPPMEPMSLKTERINLGTPPPQEGREKGPPGRHQDGNPSPTGRPTPGAEKRGVSEDGKVMHPSSRSPQNSSGRKSAVQASQAATLQEQMAAAGGADGSSSILESSEGRFLSHVQADELTGSSPNIEELQFSVDINRPEGKNSKHTSKP
ncbi:hypothetical protein H8959_017233 [Pygathrix nigripes]